MTIVHYRCGTCHIAHLGEGAAEKAPPFLRVDSEKGEICSNCHVAKLVIAGSGHASVRSRRQPADYDARGICGSCHAPHNNKGPLLWAKTPGAGNTPVDGLCLSCHRNPPSPAEHPATVLAWSQPVREALGVDTTTEMPVFEDHRPRGAIPVAFCRRNCYPVSRHLSLCRWHLVMGSKLIQTRSCTGNC